MGTHTQTNRIIREEEPRLSRPSNPVEARAVHLAATELAASLSWLPGRSSAETFSERCKKLTADFKNLFKDVDEAYTKNPKSEDLLWLRNNAQQLSSAGRLVASELVPLRDLPVVSDKNEMLPRVLAIAEGVLENTNATFSKKEFTAFCTAFEETTPLEFHEIGALVPTLKLVVLERIATCGRSAVDDPTSKAGKGVVPNIRILQHVTQTSWKDELETLIPFDRILREDPAGAYTAMDIESRNIYREKVAKIAQRSDLTEMEVAKEALALARATRKKKFAEARAGLRESHIGYYLVAEGADVLCRRVGFHASFDERFRNYSRKYPDEFLLFWSCNSYAWHRH